MFGNIFKQQCIPPVPEYLHECVDYVNTAMEREVEEIECGNCLKMSGFTVMQLVYIALGITALVLDSPLSGDGIGCLSRSQLNHAWIYSLVSIVLTFFLLYPYFTISNPPPKQSTLGTFYYKFAFTTCFAIPMFIAGIIIFDYFIGWSCLKTSLAINQFAFISWVLWTVWWIIALGRRVLYGEVDEEFEAAAEEYANRNGLTVSINESQV